MTIQLASGLRAPPSILDRTLLNSRMLPPPEGAAEFMTSSSKPNASSWPASVTTKDGRRSRVTITPSSPLKIAGTARPTSTASGHGAGFGGSSSQHVNVAPRAEV